MFANAFCNVIFHGFPSLFQFCIDPFIYRCILSCKSAIALLVDINLGFPAICMQSQISPSQRRMMQNSSVSSMQLSLYEEQIARRDLSQDCRSCSTYFLSIVIIKRLFLSTPPLPAGRRAVALKFLHS